MCHGPLESEGVRCPVPFSTAWQVTLSCQQLSSSLGTVFDTVPPNPKDISSITLFTNKYNATCEEAIAIFLSTSTHHEQLAKEGTPKCPSASTEQPLPCYRSSSFYKCIDLNYVLVFQKSRHSQVWQGMAVEALPSQDHLKGSDDLA